MYKTVLFDLDGTLTDSGRGIKNTVIYALEKFGIDATGDNLDPFIGPPLFDSFKNFYGLSDADAHKAVAYYREEFPKKGIFENEIYSGVIELLSSLRESGRTLVVATSKPEKFTLMILEHFGLLKYFDAVVGATFDGTLSKKEDIIRVAIERVGAKKDETVMVGDTKFDVIGAHENGIPCIAVLYGFGSEEELREHSADFFAPDTKTVGDIVLSKV